MTPNPGQAGHTHVLVDVAVAAPGSPDEVPAVVGRVAVSGPCAICRQMAHLGSVTVCLSSPDVDLPNKMLRCWACRFYG